MMITRGKDRPRSRRSGYALLLVIGFNVLLLAVWGVAYRSVGVAYRVEMARNLRRTRDDGTMTALGQGVALLRTGSPTNPDGSPLTGSESYACYARIDEATGSRWFAVVYTPQPVAPDGTSQGGLWSIRAYPVPYAGSPMMPDSFARQ